MRLPSGLNTGLTLGSGEGPSSRRAFLVRRSQIVKIESRLVLTSFVPSGLTASCKNGLRSASVNSFVPLCMSQASIRRPFFTYARVPSALNATACAPEDGNDRILFPVRASQSAAVPELGAPPVATSLPFGLRATSPPAPSPERVSRTRDESTAS